jgi:hypothetical protein
MPEFTWLAPSESLQFLIVSTTEIGNKIYHSYPAHCGLYSGPATPVLERAVARATVTIGIHSMSGQSAPVMVGGSDTRLARRFRQLLHCCPPASVEEDCYDVQLFISVARSVPETTQSWIATVVADELRQRGRRLLG